MTWTPDEIEDWNPETYGRFRGLRLRPAMDLMAQVGELPEGAMVDLGCGAGAAAEALKARFPGRRLLGVDGSPAMLARARGKGYDALEETDIARWSPSEKPALIFSNAVLHWLPDHGWLMPRLAGLLAPEGMLAVQMPRQNMAPSHTLLREVAVSMFPERFDFAGYEPPAADASAYWKMLSPLGTVNAWETEYVQQMLPREEIHPVHTFTRASAMRPFLEKMSVEEQKEYAATYDSAVRLAYPLRADGSCLMPFRRVFFTLKV